MTTRAKKWNGNLLPRNFSSFGRKTFHIYFWLKVRTKVFLALVTNLTSFCCCCSYAFISSFSTGLTGRVLSVFVWSQNSLYLYPVYKTWCPFTSTFPKRKGWTGFHFIRILVPGIVDKIWFPFHQEDSKEQHFFPF